MYSLLKSAMKQNCKPCQYADEPQPTKIFPKHKDLSRTEQRYVGRTAIKVYTTDTRLCPVYCELNHCTPCL